MPCVSAMMLVAIASICNTGALAVLSGTSVTSIARYRTLARRARPCASRSPIHRAECRARPARFSLTRVNFEEVPIFMPLRELLIEVLASR